MFVASLTVLLRLYSSNSLKEKRSVILGLRRSLRQKHNVAVAEVAEQNSRRLAGLAIVTVAGSRAVLDREIEAVSRKLDGDVRFEMIERTLEVY